MTLFLNTGSSLTVDDFPFGFKGLDFIFKSNGVKVKCPVQECSLITDADGNLVMIFGG